jgi:hypothetical protein
MHRDAAHVRHVERVRNSRLAPASEVRASHRFTDDPTQTSDSENVFVGAYSIGRR